jgi:hypothetical protein
MLSAIATLIMTLVLVLFPVLIPAAVTAFHALAQLRRRRTHARAERDRIGYVAEPAPATI